MTYKTLTALLLASCFTLTACGGEQKTNEQKVAEAQAYRDQETADARALFSNQAELDKILAELLQRPELQGAEFKIQSIRFDLHKLGIETFGRNSKADNPAALTSYHYSLINKKWSNPIPVKVIGGGKARDIETTVSWQDAKPDLGMVFAKADEIIKQLPQGETIKGLTSITFYPNNKNYVAETALQETTHKIYNFKLNEKGEIIKKNW